MRAYSYDPNQSWRKLPRTHPNYGESFPNRYSFIIHLDYFIKDSQLTWKVRTRNQKTQKDQKDEEIARDDREENSQEHTQTTENHFQIDIHLLYT